MTTQAILFRRAFCFVLIAMLVGVGVLPASAATYTVGCDPNNATRVAELINTINVANASPADDTLNLAAGCTYILTAVNNVIDGSNGLPSILSKATSGILVINASGATIIRDTSAPNFRIFHIASGADVIINAMSIFTGSADAGLSGGGVYNAGKLTIQNSTVSENTADVGAGLYNDGELIINGGSLAGNIASLNGGGIFNNASLTITNSAFTGNHALNGGGIFNTGSMSIQVGNFSYNTAADTTHDGGESGGNGGGIYNENSLTVVAVTFANNTARDTSPESDNYGANGGAIFNTGLLNLSQSTFTDNQATDIGGDGGNGGAIAVEDGTAVLDMNTFTNNDVSSSGGGINNLGTLTVERSIFSYHSSDQGGGIANYATLTVRNSTFFRNGAFAGGGIYAIGPTTVTSSTFVENASGVGMGGGIYIHSGPLIVGNNLFAKNEPSTSPSGRDIAGIVTSQGYNLISSSGGVTGLVVSDIKDAAATPLNIGGLADNGGLTQTIALLPGSVAINRGNPAFTPPPDTDQRGDGFPRVQQGRIDIGAFEAPGNSLNIQLTLQGRPIAPNPQWITTIRVEIRPLGGGAPVLVGSFVSDEFGQVTVTNLPAGNFNIWIKGTHTLAQVHAVTLATGSNNLTTLLLLEGDADDSNTVVLTDFSLLASSFGKASGEPGFDARADFNQDGFVTLPDFSLLASNFNQAGAP